ncbi:tRNA (guanine(9)-N(1))-methyltransferase [Orbilia ellipsospora]|uniref:tRNA (guanine(9)-N1)-methyltransferase n=1 Tax=Orbilia ellipsospora TaxID=2528407 RepID=A0AAV9XM86_9PEZI
MTNIKLSGDDNTQQKLTLDAERKRKRTESPTFRASITRDSSDHPAPQGNGDPATVVISKNQQKRLLKKQKWEESRESRRALRREKTAAKRVRQREARDAAIAHPLNITADPDATSTKKRKNNRKLERKSKRLDIKCIVDCSFDDYMTDKEVASLGAQVSRCYSDNRVAKFSMDLWLTCVDKRLRSHLSLMHGDKWKSWRKITITEKDYDISTEGTNVENIIYLSSDSADTLEALEEGKTYIVGGIVDKNRYKGLCFNKATKQRLRTAKLPIGEYIKMTGRVTLTTNQVVEIMLKWLELRNWKGAFEKVIPMRKKMNDTLRDDSLGSEKDVGERDEFELEGGHVDRFRGDVAGIRKLVDLEDCSEASDDSELEQSGAEVTLSLKNSPNEKMTA